MTVELEEKKLELASRGVREPSKQEEMAKAEVARRLGPGSHVLKLREVYLKTAVHEGLRDGLTKYLTDAFHQKGGTLKVDANDLQETLSHHKDVLKAKLPELLMAGSFEGYWEGELGGDPEGEEHPRVLAARRPGQVVLDGHIGRHVVAQRLDAQVVREGVAP